MNVLTPKAGDESSDLNVYYSDDSNSIGYSIHSTESNDGSGYNNKLNASSDSLSSYISTYGYPSYTEEEGYVNVL